ncbi:uncharacterized protein LOC113467573, partial [Diaphorina citri]|uniref:nitric-oxide synthase (NADPH) n=1 Tax=Diaphorina citri TaxID=121845 RepID=A0A3Q0ITM1_DIACI
MFQAEVDKVKGDMHVLEDRFKGMEDKVESVDDRVRNFEDKLAEMSNNITRQVIGQVVQHPSSSLSTVVPERANPARMKPPVFDGQMAWSIFKRQFEAACECNLYSAKEKVTALMLSLRGPAADLIQTLPKDSNLSYDELVSVIERRFGDDHMQDVYRIQLQNRVQKSGETLQQLQADIDRLAHLSYGTGHPEILNHITTAAFIDAIADRELQQALRLAGKKTPAEALAYALQVESAKQASRRSLRVRQVSVSDKTDHYSPSAQYVEKAGMRCWHCNSKGHLQRDCKKRKQMSSPECWTCGARGHIQSDCRKRRRFETFLSRPTTRSETREKIVDPSQSPVERRRLNYYVFDCRSVTTSSNMFEAICNHIKYATNKGNIRSVTTSSNMFEAICNHIKYATNKGNIRSVTTSSNMFEAICNHIKYATNKGNIRYDWFKELGLRWYAVPAVSGMMFDCGGLQFTAAPFNGWYMSTEIGCRDLCDTKRYNICEIVANKMGLDTGSNVTLWKDKVNVEVNIAVLHSFQVTIRYDWFKELGLRWYAVPAVSGMMFDCGGLQFTAAPFNGWYMSTEIGCRDLCDTKRYNICEVLRMDEYDMSSIEHEALILVVASTFGNGDPPENGQEFAQNLHALRIGEDANNSISTIGCYVLRMDEYDMSSIEHEALILVVASTFGNGDPPENGQEFAQNLHALRIGEDANNSISTIG